MWWLYFAISYVDCTTRPFSVLRTRRALFRGLPSESNIMRYPTSPIQYYIPSGAGNSNSYADFSMVACRDSTAQNEMESTFADALAHFTANINISFEQTDTVGPGVWIVGAVPTGSLTMGALFNKTIRECTEGCYVSTIGTAYSEDWPLNVFHLGGGHNSFGSIVHEIGHKLGMAHEHTRSDVTNYLNLPDNINDFGAEWKDQWQWWAGNDPARPINTFDMCSNQMYPIQSSDNWDDDLVSLTDLGKQALITCINENPDIYADMTSCGAQCRSINTINEGCQVSCLNRAGLSAGDIAALSTIYGATVTTTTITPATAASHDDLTIYLGVGGGAAIVIVVILLCRKSPARKSATVAELF